MRQILSTKFEILNKFEFPMFKNQNCLNHLDLEFRNYLVFRYSDLEFEVC